MNQKTYFIISGTFFIADVVFHAIRLAVWWQTTYIMQIPLWVSPLAVLFCGLLFWHALRMGRGGV